jgi:putative membrane protein
MPSTKITDHLANERTFLAWVRTSIALMGFGVVIARLRFLVIELAGRVPASTHMTNRSTWLGLAFAGVGLITLVFATFSYNRTRHAIDAGTYEPLGNSLLAMSIVIFLLGLFAIAYLVTLARF